MFLKSINILYMTRSSLIPLPYSACNPLYDMPLTHLYHPAHCFRFHPPRLLSRSKSSFPVTSTGLRFPQPMGTFTYRSSCYDATSDLEIAFSPSRRIFFAAFTFLSCTAPHFGHCQIRLDRLFKSSFSCPQMLHTRFDG